MGFPGLLGSEIEERGRIERGSDVPGQRTSWPLEDADELASSVFDRARRAEANSAVQVNRVIMVPVAQNR